MGESEELSRSSIMSNQHLIASGIKSMAEHSRNQTVPTSPRSRGPPPQLTKQASTTPPATPAPQPAEDETTSSSGSVLFRNDPDGGLRVLKRPYSIERTPTEQQFDEGKYIYIILLLKVY